MSQFENIVKLQQTPSQIRNICVIAHVDHGKTTLSDCLLSSNGIISQKLAGKVRYLDSREDEQQRGITMESSAISLFFRHISADSDNQKLTSDYLVNLIDSPGHVDFSSEVSSASRLCDGALLLVDALEGVGAQTQTVLNQAMKENLKIILVINKIDRLLFELKFTENDAFEHLLKLITQVNAILGSYEAQQILKDNYVEESEFYFSPEKGNVIFASAVDGWAFRTLQFAKIYASKLGVEEDKLNQFLWGHYYLDPKSKKVIGQKALKGRNLKPLFVQFILSNIWQVYEAALGHDLMKQEKIIKSLGVKILPRELKSKDSRALLQSIMSQWLPLSHAALLAVVQKVPAPPQAQKLKVGELVPSEFSEIRSAIGNCDSENENMVCYLSKVFAVPTVELPIVGKIIEETKQGFDMRRQAIARSQARQLMRNSNENEDLSTNLESPAPANEALVGLARIYSGTIKVGEKIHVLGPKYQYSNRETHKYCSEMIVERLFLIMGKELKDLDKVPAGNVFGVICSDSEILKTATLSSTPFCPSLAGLGTAAPPILSVAVEPQDPTKLPQLMKGLELLNKADTCVEVEYQETGEHVIKCAGELHVERCVKDLKERFAKIDITVSEPLVPFKETISLQAKELDSELPCGTVLKTSADNSVSIRLRVVPLADSVRSFLLNASYRNEPGSKEILSGLSKAIIEDGNEAIPGNFGVDWNKLLTNVIAFGPKTMMHNVLINDTGLSAVNWDGSLSNDGEKLSYVQSIISGFHMTTSSGPLCAEPMAGVAVIIEDVHYNDSNTAIIPGIILSLVKEAIKIGFLQWSPRLMLAYYRCELQTEAQYLGKVDGVLSRRRGQIISEDIKDGTSLFTLEATLPIVESFGFVDELMKKTSGVASPQLVFSGFQLLDLDPYWVPTTEEELEDLGELADRENIAKRYMEKVRVRKGMAIEKKLVEHAEKQRTMKNK